MKTIRASQGAIFDVYHERVDLVSKIKLLKEQGYLIVGATAHGNLITKTSDKVALVLGNEGAGISSKIDALLDLENTIKTENVESLNVSIAGSILMYEWSK